jgi:anti-sigma B factor antagonist
VTATSVDPYASELVSVDVSGSGPAVTVSAAGEVDSTSAPLLRQQLETLLDGDVRELVVDLCQVTFLDSAGLCVLAAAHRRSARQDVTMRVLASSRAVIRPLQITGLWELLGVERVDGHPKQQGVA